MSLTLGSTVINVADIERAQRFWCAALGYVVREADADFVVLTDPAREWSKVSLQRSPDVKIGRNRLHLDLDADDQQAEVERLLALGAGRPAWQYPPDPDFVVLTDPDGNEFCVIDTNHSGNTST